MSRPVDWSPLADSDPVPGDPDAVAELAGRYRRTAANIRQAAAALKRIASAEGWDSAAGEKFRERAIDVADTVLKAEGRYQAAGDALAGYAPALRSAQRRADQALRDAQDAERDLQSATSRLDPTAEPGSPEAADSQRAQRAADDASGRLDAARRALGTAVADRDGAAESAKGRIENVTKDDGLKDSWWDDFAPVLKTITRVAGAIAAIAGVLSLVVGWIPVIGQALAAVLGTIALVASIVSLLGNLALALTGKGGWGDVLLDAISVATFGIGRAFASASKLSAVAARGTAWRTARSMVRSGQLTGRLQGLIGGRLAGAGSRMIARGGSWGSSMGQGVAGLRPGRLLGDLATDWRTVRRSLHALPTTGAASGTEAVTRTLVSAKDTFSAAARSGGPFRGPLNALFANPDLARDLDQTRRFAPQLLTDPSVARLVNQANVQNAIGLGGQVIGSSVDSYQFAGLFDTGPDVTAEPAGTAPR